MSEAADGMGILAASGMEANDIMEISKDMFDLMSAGSVDADTSASILTATMAQFNLTADDSGYIVDTFAATAASAEVGVDTLQHTMSQAGGVLAGMNMSVVESTAAIGHLANTGLPVEQLGTMMKAMGREVGASADELKKMGVDAFDPVTGKAKGMHEVMGQLEKSLEGKNEAEINSALSTVFSGQALQGATEWIKRGSEAYNELTEDVKRQKNAAETMAAIQEDTVGGAFRGMKSAIEGFMIEIGDVIKKPVQEVALFIKDLAGKFGQLDGPTKETIVKLAAVAAAIGPIIWAGSKLLSGVRLVGVAFSFIFSPIGLLVGALAALAGATVYLWKTNEDFRDGVIQVWDTVKEKVGSAVEAVSGYWDEHGEAIISKATAIFDAIGEKIMGAVEWFKEFWATHGESITEVISITFETIKTVIGGALEIIVEVVSSAVSWMSDFWSEHGETIKTATSVAWDLISGIISGAMEVIQGAIDVVLGVIQGDWDRVWVGIQGIFEGVMTAVGAAWNVAKEIVGSVIKGTIDAVTDKFMELVEKAQNAWETAKNIITAPIKGVMNIARNIKDKVTGGGADGSHASGAYNIPKNNYLANLHKGEMVLTANASDQYRAMGGTENSTPPQIASNTSTTSNQSSATFAPVVNITVEAVTGAFMDAVEKAKEVMSAPIKGVMNIERNTKDRVTGGTENSTPQVSSSTSTTSNQSTASFSPVVNINIEGDASGDNVRDLERMMRDVFKREQESFFNKLNLQNG